MSKDSIINILEDFFLYIEKLDIKSNSLTTEAIIEIYNSIENNNITKLVTNNNLNDIEEINRTIDDKKNYLYSLNEKIKDLKQPISYFISEITDNMQQHSNSDKGFIFTNYNKEKNQIELVLADGGISIYGSYVNSNKFIENIKNSDVLAVGIAKEGYSTKDRPEAENRGYGLPSNIKMITQGLNGDLAILSGNALFVASIDKLVELPETIDWKGTLIFASIPVDIPQSFNFYNYIQ